jgi:signal transduction histidine kinase
VVIDNVSTDARYRDHHTPRIYGFQSYVSIPLFRPDGGYFGTLCGLDPTAAPLSKKTTVTSLTLFAQLISTQLLAETELADVKEALHDEQATAELREQFIAVLGHDIRNPLGAILNGTDLLLLGAALEPKMQATVQRIQRSARRIGALVDDVVDFTRGRMGGGITLDLRHETNLADKLEQVIAELQSSYPQRDIRSALAIRAPLLCDAGRIAQLLSNLLKNALVHGAPDAPVTVSAQSAAGIFSIAVTNGGPAIPAEKLKQLFKPYFRGTPSASQEGLGLGLFIVAEIARSHGGEIDVTSDANGTCFQFVLKSPEFTERRSLPPAHKPATERRATAVS